ncbi:MAG: NACHT domain-containing protein [Elainellaceae cyanobacterium]
MSPPHCSDSPQDSNLDIDIQNSERVNLAEGDRNVQGQENQAVLGESNRVNQAKRDVYQAETIIIQPVSERPGPAAVQKRPKAEQILLEAVATEVDDRLQQSLHNAVFITLPKENQRDRVRRPWDGDVKIGTGEKQPLPEGLPVADVFRQRAIGGKLLILGEPGSGKTTMLLDLARGLIQAAQNDADVPIPVLFNLSSWAGVKPANQADSIVEWMVRELKLKYVVSEKLGEAWLAGQKLLPLLDGLDEVAAERQADCLRAINQFLQGERATGQLAVCCREEEYNQLVQAAGDRLQLHGAICLKPLSAGQVKGYLVELGCGELWRTVEVDAELLELIQTPLWLSLSVLAQKELDLTAWGREPSLEKRRDQLLDAYVRRMLHDAPVVSRAYAERGVKEPTARQTRYWLVWLAQRLKEESQDEFLIERMQPKLLLKTRWQKWQYRLTVGLIGGLTGGLIGGLIGGLVIEPTVGLIGGLVIGPIVGLISGSIAGLISGLIGGLSGELDSIELVETFSFLPSQISWKEFIVRLSGGLIGGLTIGLLGRIIGGLIGGLIIGLMGGLIIGSIAELRTDIQLPTMPNQGIKMSAKHTAIFTATALSLAPLLYIGLSTILPDALSEVDISYTIGMTVFTLVGGGFYFGGGLPCIQHLALRRILYTSDRIPWNYARFLNYSTDRLLLQRVGGRYRFIHKLVQEHFAAMPLDTAVAERSRS